jgi:hypothetical protein
VVNVQGKWVGGGVAGRNELLERLGTFGTFETGSFLNCGNAKQKSLTRDKQQSAREMNHAG